MKTSNITKGIILTLIFVLSNNICKAQLDFLQYHFGDTKEELIKNTVYNEQFQNYKISVYDSRKSDEITFTLEYDVGLEGGGITYVKSTCLFKNNIFYKVKNVMRLSSRERDSKGRRVENGPQMLYRINKEMIEKEWYTEDESEEVRCCDKGYYASYWTKPNRAVWIYCIPKDTETLEQSFGLNITVIE